MEQKALRVLAASGVNNPTAVAKEIRRALEGTPPELFIAQKGRMEELFEDLQRLKKALAAAEAKLEAFTGGE